METERRNGTATVGIQPTERLPPAPLTEPLLLIAAADGTWTLRPLVAGSAFTIGRGTDADILVDERVVSRLHARLEVTGAGELWLSDLSSVNGTVVGGRLVRDARVMVRPGETILIGRTILAIHAPPLAEGTRSPGAMAGVDALVARVAPTSFDVLLLGETGVGKGVVAERIHRQSRRAAGPWVQLNCAGLSAALLESELFGHERGAFTGALQSKRGLLETAAGGTVFLDEVGEMPLEVQAKLLLAIENRVARRVGSNQSMPIDVRFICATHRDLEAEIQQGRFRADFYHRINGFAIRIPPLRERLPEIEGLIWQFASEAAARANRTRPVTFEDEARARLHHHDWPGNIRELRGVIERAVLLAEGDVVTARVILTAGLPDGDLPPTPDGAAEDAERERVVAALAECGGNQSRAALLLRLSRNTLLARIRRYGIKRPRGQRAPS